MTEWKEYKLGEIAVVKGGKRLPKGEMLVEYETPYPYIRVTDMTQKWIGKKDLLYVPEQVQNSISRYTVSSGDVILSIVGSIGLVSRVGQDIDGANLTENCVKIIPTSTILDSDYLYYYLISANGQEEINKRNVGAVQPKLPIYNINDIEIPLPSLDEQHRIAAILSSLDDKIDLLHRENATLEQMAETLFRQWFVEEAKEEWKEGTVADFAQHCKESINPQKHLNTVFQHYSIPAFDDGKEPTIETGESIQSNKFVIPTNCILFSKLNPHKDKRVWLMLDDVPENAICSTEFQIVKPINSDYLYFLYGWLTNKENYDEIASGVGGTSGSHQRIDPKSIFSFTCPNVDSDTIRNYNNKVEPLFYKIRNNQKQIQTLIKTRDGLLPRLMNEEI